MIPGMHGKVSAFSWKKKEFFSISKYFLFSYSCPKVLHQLYSFFHLKAMYISESQINKEPIVRDGGVGQLDRESRLPFRKF